MSDKLNDPVRAAVSLLTTAAGGESRQLRAEELCFGRDRSIFIWGDRAGLLALASAVADYVANVRPHPSRE